MLKQFGNSSVVQSLKRKPFIFLVLARNQSDISKKHSFSPRHGQIHYPEKSLLPKKHPYDHETHKKYAAAMSYLKSKKRRKLGVFVENKSMICDLISQGYEPSHVFYFKEEVLKKIKDIPMSTKCIQLTERQLSTLTDVKTDQGIMAVFDKPNIVSSLEKSIPLIVYLDRIRDPGNVGTIIRSAAGAACTAVVSSPITASFWLPSTLRASAAANYLIPLHEHMEFMDVLDSLPTNWKICFVETQGSENDISENKIKFSPYYETDFKSPTLMVFGREVGGLSHQLKKHAIERGSHEIVSTYIPIIERLDSINVAMAASVLIFEMAKQQTSITMNNNTAKVVNDSLSNVGKQENISRGSNDVIDGLNKMFPTPSVIDSSSVTIRNENHPDER